MKAKITQTYQDGLTGNVVRKGDIFEIIEDKPEYGFVTGEFINIGSRFTMNVWRTAFKKIDYLAQNP